MGESKVSQNAQILRHLKKGRSLTPIEALDKFGTFRLAARVSELRQAGNNIQTARAKNPVTGRWYARYRLAL